jgi:hypothetical protein
MVALYTMIFYYPPTQAYSAKCGNMLIKSRAAVSLTLKTPNIRKQKWQSASFLLAEFPIFIMALD